MPVGGVKGACRWARERLNYIRPTRPHPESSLRDRRPCRRALRAVVRCAHSARAVWEGGLSAC